PTSSRSTTTSSRIADPRQPFVRDRPADPHLAGQRARTCASLLRGYAINALFLPTMSNETASAPKSFEFQAEIKQLLDIVIHSLYTEKEIFLRELVSNASDATEKLRHLQLTEKAVHDADRALEITVTPDEKAKTLTIED